MELQHSQTWKNLQTAFSGELHACAKYKIYALRAREDGYEQMGNIFDETSRNEQEHAEIWLKHLSGGEVPGTLENLRDAAAGEHYEWTEMYAEFARTARREGFEELAELFTLSLIHIFCWEKQMIRQKAKKIIPPPRRMHGNGI